MKRLLAIILAAAVLWSGFWAVSAWQMARAVDAWFDARRAEGWQASYDTRRLRGFPSRVDVSFDQIKLRDPGTGLGWDIPFFQILMLAYQPGHKILVFADEQVIHLDRDSVAIDSAGLRASVVHDAQGQILRANAEAQTLNLSGARGAQAFANLTAAVQSTADQSAQYRVALSAASAAGLPDRVDGLKLQAEVGFDTIWTLAALETSRPQPTRLDLQLAEYTADGLALKLAGALDVDPDGVAEGQLTLKAVNWRDKLDAAQNSGAVPEALATALQQMLGVVAGLRGNPATLDVPLVFSGGRVWIGVLPMGKAPALRLP